MVECAMNRMLDHEADRRDGVDDGRSRQRLTFFGVDRLAQLAAQVEPDARAHDHQRDADAGRRAEDDLQQGLGAHRAGARAQDARGRSRWTGHHERAGDDGRETRRGCGALREFTEPREQIRAHHLPRARQALAHRCVGNTEQTRDLLRTLAFAIEQQQRLAAFFRQRGDQLAGRARAFFVDQGLGRRGRGIGGGGDRRFHVVDRIRPAHLRAQMIARQVARDLPQPRQETVGVLQAAQVLPRVEEGVLRDVLAARHVTHDRQRDRRDRVLAGDDDAPVGIAVAGARGGEFEADQLVDVGVHVHQDVAGCPM